DDERHPEPERADDEGQHREDVTQPDGEVERHVAAHGVHRPLILLAIAPVSDGAAWPVNAACRSFEPCHTWTPSTPNRAATTAVMMGCSCTRAASTAASAFRTTYMRSAAQNGHSSVNSQAWKPRHLPRRPSPRAVSAMMALLTFSVSATPTWAWAWAICASA